MKYKINYLLTIDNGELVDEAKNFEFESGDGQLTQQLENCITESLTNKLQTLLLKGADIFGEYNENSLVVMEKSTMPNDFKIASAIDFDMPNGEKTIGVIKKIMQTQVLIDFNHPLSKCNIAFQFEILNKS